MSTPEVRRLVPHVVEGVADADTVTWARAMTAAFLRPRVEPADLARAAASYAGQRLRGVYETGDPAPVVTLRSWDSQMTVPGGEVTVDAVTSIGVRSTHRRRGLLRAVLVDDLAEAARAGTPVAALTSTQGALYERFGFGLASWTRSLRLDARAARFRVPEPTGRLRTLDVATLPSAAAPVQDRARRRHPGSMDRVGHSWSALMTGLNTFSGMVPDRGRHAVLWSDATGRPGGYVVYRVARDWVAEDGGEIAVLDLQATTPESYRELWRHLASLDLVGSVTWSDASVDEPLPWLLDDHRPVTAGTTREMLWLRILDVPAALGARRYPVTDRVVLAVDDPARYAAGTWALDTTDPVAPRASSTTDEPDVALDAATLGALYLGGVDPRVLARAGRLEERTPGAAGRLARLLAAPSVPWNGIRF
ncbi:GNAT family N-acetyltransferase [Actinomycetospora straminea]|uniref:GNAT family N-acetyltransferase n=1 Tax=Actinomycetospora straminea TaxID=663607 RepID=A0ABP9F4E7_9PSEU|nr:GNAT family N-acetyltransferase [Actinomycetospora straminea]MDD7931721.1 GNAT family N-acetyltransferase [Actinomycetospora straminea]